MNGSGCKTCPVQNCTAQYRGSACTAMRDQYGLGDPKTNFDNIRAMNDEELADFLCSIAYKGQPWSEPFVKKFCHNCPAECICEDGRKLYLHECDFVGGKCPHGSDVVWWLHQPAESVGHE